MRAKFGVLEQTQGLHLQAKFHLNALCRLPVAKNHNFWQILTFWGLLYRPPFTHEGHNTHAMYACMPKFVLIGLYYRPLLAKTANFYRFLD